jgi:hypothetical protein
MYCGKTEKAGKGFLPETIRNRLCTNRLAMDSKTPFEMLIVVAVIGNFRYSYRV